MHPPLVSVVVPVFDGEAYLAQALDSILAQSHRALDVIVVDDGSRDGSRRLAASYGPPVRVESLPRRQGPAAACNAGVAVAEGAFVAFLDADDLWHPLKLERQLARFAERDGLDCSLTGIQNFVPPELGGDQSLDPELLRPQPGWSTCTLLARRAVFERVGLFATEHRHSYKTRWFLQARELDVEMEMLPDVLAHRRLHGESMSQQEAAPSQDEHLTLVKEVLDRRRALQDDGS